MKKEAVKNKWLLVRITPEEKAEFDALAKANGFDTLSSFVLWAMRKQKNAFRPTPADSAAQQFAQTH